MQREISASVFVTAALWQTLSFGIHTWPRCPAPIPTVHATDSASQNDALDHSAIPVVLTSYHESQIDETKNRQCANTTGRTRDYTDIYGIYIKRFTQSMNAHQRDRRRKGPDHDLSTPLRTTTRNRVRRGRPLAWILSKPRFQDCTTQGWSDTPPNTFQSILICSFIHSTAGTNPSDI